MLRWWAALLKEWFSFDLHGHQVNALVDISMAMAQAGHCHCGRVALAMGTASRVISHQRRIERLLANPRLCVDRVMLLVVRGLMQIRPANRYLLVLDETPRSNALRVMSLRLLVGHRAVPLAISCYRPDAPPMPMPRLIERMLRLTQRALPKEANVTLLTDRGLTWPSILDVCNRLGWHFVGRVQGHTRFKRADGTEAPIDQLCPHPGDRFSGRMQTFAKAGWRELSVICLWEPVAKEPWLLVSDLPPIAMARYADYYHRMRCEESFRDDKSSGWQWQQSRVHDPTHASRLLLLMALASLLALEIGRRLVKGGYRRMLDAHTIRRLSDFQLGQRWIAHHLHLPRGQP
jgi:hypothetical protein